VLERLWADIADIFAAKDHRLLFELLNEPHRSDSSNSPMPVADLRAMSSLAYGEWGVGWGSRYTTMDCNNIRSWYQKMAENAPAKGIPTSLWDDNGWFKVWDIGSKSWNNNLVDCIAGTCAWNGTDRFNADCK